MRNAEFGMRNEKEKLIDLLDAEFMWSETECEAVADYLLSGGLGFVDDVREECGHLLAAKDVIINDMNEEIKRLSKENELLWRKQTPIPMDGYKCPVCETQQHYDHTYCNKCGQALKAERDKPRYFVRDNSCTLDEVITDDIELLTDINDRS